MSRPKFALTDFRKASRSPNDPTKADCVHVARGHEWAIVRDTKREFGSESDHQLGFSTEKFDAFQERVRALNLRSAVVPVGALDGLCIVIERLAEDMNRFRSAEPQAGEAADAVLVYTDDEIAAFFDGIHNNEFDADGTHAACTHVECVAVRAEALAAAL